MNLMMVSDFIQVQGIMEDYLTKDNYFSKREEIFMINLL
jgi:hypothetical protein